MIQRILLCSTSGHSHGSSVFREEARPLRKTSAPETETQPTGIPRRNTDSVPLPFRPVQKSLYCPQLPGKGPAPYSEKIPFQPQRRSLLPLRHSQDIQRFLLFLPHFQIQIPCTYVGKNPQQKKQSADRRHTEPAVFQILNLPGDNLRLAGEEHLIRFRSVRFPKCFICLRHIPPDFNLPLRFAIPPGHRDSLPEHIPEAFPKAPGRSPQRPSASRHFPLRPKQIQIRQICFQQIHRLHNSQLRRFPGI